MTTQPVPQRQVMTGGLTFLFAVAGGAAVGNLYWAQPLLDLIADDLNASTATAGWLITATQIGSAAGILFLVPLGDVLNRRLLIPVMMLCSAAALAGRSVVGIIVVVVVIDVALQAVGILNQLRVFAVSHEARSRLNTAYGTSNFIAALSARRSRPSCGPPAAGQPCRSPGWR